jgi:hypothetical protein
VTPCMQPRWLAAVGLAAVFVACATRQVLAQPTPAPDPATTPDAKPTLPPDEDGEPRLSLPTEADRVAWQRDGFRLGLGFEYGELYGLDGAPGANLKGIELRAGLRLDRSWSAIATLDYALASEPDGMQGVRFAGTLDLTWHATRSFSLAIGSGFGGVVESDTGRDDARPFPDELETSYTFPDASTPVQTCSGVGAAGRVRAEYAYVLGPRTSVTLAAQALGQWTGCVDDTGRVEPDTGDAIVRRLWWPHVGYSFALGVLWR